jgi:F-type H+-transporting ATPase subunit epsilon
VRVSARQALRGERLDTLEQEIGAARERELETAKHERVAATRLHAQAVRSLVAHLKAPSADGDSYA